MRVVDEQGNSLAGIPVQLSGVGEVVYTDSEGIATFTDVRVGEYNIVYTHWGRDYTKKHVLSSTLPLGLRSEKVVTVVVTSDTPAKWLVWVGGGTLLFWLFIVLAQRRRRQRAG